MKIIFCVPGNSFSNRFLKCWTNLTKELHKRDIEYELLSQYIPNVYKVRSLLLGADRNFPTNFALSISSHGIGLSPCTLLSPS